MIPTNLLPNYQISFASSTKPPPVKSSNPIPELTTASSLPIPAKRHSILLPQQESPSVGLHHPMEENPYLPTCRDQFSPLPPVIKMPTFNRSSDPYIPAQIIVGFNPPRQDRNELDQVNRIPSPSPFPVVSTVKKHQEILRRSIDSMCQGKPCEMIDVRELFSSKYNFFFFSFFLFFPFPTPPPLYMLQLLTYQQP